MLFAGLQGEEAFYRPPYHGLRHPFIFYYSHVAVRGHLGGTRAIVRSKKRLAQHKQACPAPPRPASAPRASGT